MSLGSQKGQGEINGMAFERLLEAFWANGSAAQKELFTVAEVAKILSLGERTVESLIARGFLRSALAPGTHARRVSREMIDEYLQKFNSSPFTNRARQR
jgi:excisionase family DNA binding protein